MKLIDYRPKELKRLFLKWYSEIFNIDIEKAIYIINETKKYYNKKDIQNISYCEKLENKWYNSLKFNKPNYSLYNDMYYFTDVWVCWNMYSRRYIKDILKPNSWKENLSLLMLLKNMNSLIDVGNGIGLTTASWKEIFPNMNIFGYNLIDTYQFKFANKISKKFNFKMLSKIENKYDIIFASEYFEHFERPIEEVQNMIKIIRPQILIIANSFNTKSVGHFLNYKHNNEIIPSKNISKKFNQALKILGFQKLKTKLWNNKPNIWINQNNHKINEMMEKYKI